MGKRSTSRLALAIAVLALLVFPPTDSFAAPGWLEKLFSGQQHKAPKHRKPRPAKKSRAPSGPSAGEIRLPDTAPLPQPAQRDLSETAARIPEDGQSAAEDIPYREARAAPEALLEIVPPQPPKPQFRPDMPSPQAVRPQQPPAPADPRSARLPDPSGALPAAEIACRQRLAELGATFDNRPAEADPAGCSMPYPLTLKSLGSNVALTPEAEMNCATAEAVARFTRSVISPAARRVFGQPLKSISHASAYVCRARNGTQKLSEHAFGNALDISSFTLADGSTVAVELTPTKRNATFIDTVRDAACGPFKTVLGPGDPDHAEHLHFDLAPRRGGGTVCP